MNSPDASRARREARTPAETIARAQAVRAAIARHKPPSAEEVAALRAKLTAPDLTSTRAA